MTAGRAWSRLERRIVASLAALRPRRILVFGSRARGDADEHSDLDLVVIQETRDVFPERSKKAALLLDVPGAVDVFVYTPAEFEQMRRDGNPFIRNVIKQGRVIYEAPGRPGPLARGSRARRTGRRGRR
jgi:predicted nucleotidyltransferase